MVVYEVNIAVDAEIYDTYHPWLLDHIKEILAFDGFMNAEVCYQLSVEPNPQQHHLRVSYHIDNYDNYLKYLENHATNMRSDATNRFGSQFSITRRIFTSNVTL